MRKIKRAEHDFTEDMLPKNRVEVYQDIIKNHFSRLLGLGLILFLSLLPFNLLIINRDLSLLQLFSQLQNGLIDEVYFNQQKIAMNQTLSLFNIASLLFFGIGLSGVIRIIKRMAFMEPVRITYDFMIGIKQNGKHYSITFLLMGFWIALSLFIYHLSILNESISTSLVYSLLGLLPFIMGLFILFPIMLLMISSIAVYTHRFSGQFKVSLLSYMQKLKKVLLASLMMMLPFFLYFIQNVILHMILMIILPFVYIFFLLGWFLLSMNIFDQTINQTYYPELLNKGILGKKELKNGHIE